MDLSRWLGVNMEKLSAWWQSWGLIVEQAFKRSSKSARALAPRGQAGPEPLDDGAHSVPCLSTAGLVAFLDFARSCLRQKEHQQCAAALMRDFLGKVVPVGGAVMNIAEVPILTVRACPQAADGPLCSHMESVLGPFDGPRDLLGQSICEGL